MMSGIGLIGGVVRGFIGTNPILKFLFGNWKIVLTVILLLVIGGLWKYASHLNEKIIEVNVQLVQYREQVGILDSNIEKINKDVANATVQREKFESDINKLKIVNAQLRNRINGLSTKIPPGTTPIDAQSTIDGIQTDINKKWLSIGDQDE